VFALTAMGQALTSSHPASARPSALLVAGEFGDAWTQLLQTVHTGRSPFERRHGTSLFGHMERTPALRGIFDDSQAHGLAMELDEIMRFVDFSPYHAIVDIGGGGGAFLKRILAANPAATGVLFDLPGSAFPHGDPPARNPTVPYAVVTGDFFQEVPGGGDLYLLSHILHDWDDERCVQILRTCRRAMVGPATIMIVDLVAADPGGGDARARAAALMDLYMLSLFGGGGGRERTSTQLDTLLTKAGFRITRVDDLPSGMSAIRAVSTA
jgi:hypothetical protein